MIGLVVSSFHGPEVSVSQKSNCPGVFLRHDPFVSYGRLPCYSWTWIFERQISEYGFTFLIALTFLILLIYKMKNFETEFVNIQKM